MFVETMFISLPFDPMKFPAIETTLGKVLQFQI
jgi:hypothetical protein